jgi:hypothetical protein
VITVFAVFGHEQIAPLYVSPKQMEKENESKAARENEVHFGKIGV